MSFGGSKNPFPTAADVDAYLAGNIDYASMPEPPPVDWHNGRHNGSHNGSVGKAAAEYAPRFVLRNIGYMRAKPPKTWLVKNVVGTDDISVIYGPPGVGKSFIALDLAFSAALGRQFAMAFDVQRPFTVCYCAGEGIDGLGQRIDAAAEFYGAEPDNLYIVENVPQFSTDVRTSAETGLVRFIRDYKYQMDQGLAGALDLLIIDTYANATGDSDENDTGITKGIMGIARWAKGELGCSILFVHHSNKQGGMRGSIVFEADCTTVIECAMTVRGPEMLCRKNKEGEQWRGRNFSLVAKNNSARVWWEEPADPNAPQVNAEHGEKASDIRTILTELDANAGTLYTSASVSELIGKSRSYTINLLNELLAARRVTRELTDPSKGSSNRNPFLYGAVCAE